VDEGAEADPLDGAPKGDFQAGCRRLAHKRFKRRKNRIAPGPGHRREQEAPPPVSPSCDKDNMLV
jgi:hypothetical protein